MLAIFATGRGAILPYTSLLQIAIQDGVLFFLPSSSVPVSGITKIADGRFHHIIVQREVENNINSTVSFYVDGRLDVQKQIPDAKKFYSGWKLKGVKPVGDTIHIGCDMEWHQYFDGIIRDFALYESVLTEAERLQFYSDSLEKGTSDSSSEPLYQNNQSSGNNTIGIAAGVSCAVLILGMISLNPNV